MQRLRTVHTTRQHEIALETLGIKYFYISVAGIVAWGYVLVIKNVRVRITIMVVGAERVAIHARTLRPPLSDLTAR